MNLEEFRKALSSDATEENAQLKRQLSDLQTEYHEKLSKVIHFEQHEVPTIDYTTSVVNKVACDRVIYQKGESNVSKI